MQEVVLINCTITGVWSLSSICKLLYCYGNVIANTSNRVSLMSKPTWFESSNNISEISEQSFQNAAKAALVDTQKVRCLWLISFIQDMRTLMAFSSRLYMDGLLLQHRYPHLKFIMTWHYWTSLSRPREMYGRLRYTVCVHSCIIISWHITRTEPRRSIMS